MEGTSLLPIFERKEENPTTQNTIPPSPPANSLSIARAESQRAVSFICDVVVEIITEFRAARTIASQLLDEIIEGSFNLRRSCHGMARRKVARWIENGDELAVTERLRRDRRKEGEAIGIQFFVKWSVVEVFVTNAIKIAEKRHIEIQSACMRAVQLCVDKTAYHFEHALATKMSRSIIVDDIVQHQLWNMYHKRANAIAFETVMYVFDSAVNNVDARTKAEAEQCAQECMRDILRVVGDFVATMYVQRRSRTRREALGVAFNCLDIILNKVMGVVLTNAARKRERIAAAMGGVVFPAAAVVGDSRRRYGRPWSRVSSAHSTSCSSVSSPGFSSSRRSPPSQQQQYYSGSGSKSPLPISGNVFGSPETLESSKILNTSGESPQPHAGRVTLDGAHFPFPSTGSTSMVNRYQLPNSNNNNNYQRPHTTMSTTPGSSISPYTPQRSLGRFGVPAGAMWDVFPDVDDDRPHHHHNNNNDDAFSDISTRPAVHLLASMPTAGSPPSPMKGASALSKASAKFLRHYDHHYNNHHHHSSGGGSHRHHHHHHHRHHESTSNANSAATPQSYSSGGLWEEGQQQQQQRPATAGSVESGGKYSIWSATTTNSVTSFDDAQNWLLLGLSEEERLASLKVITAADADPQRRASIARSGERRPSRVSVNQSGEDDGNLSDDKRQRRASVAAATVTTSSNNRRSSESPSRFNSSSGAGQKKSARRRSSNNNNNGEPGTTIFDDRQNDIIDDSFRIVVKPAMGEAGGTIVPRGDPRPVSAALSQVLRMDTGDEDFVDEPSPSNKEKRKRSNNNINNNNTMKTSNKATGDNFNNMVNYDSDDEELVIGDETGRGLSPRDGEEVCNDDHPYLVYQDNRARNPEYLKNYGENMSQILGRGDDNGGVGGVGGGDDDDEEDCFYCEGDGHSIHSSASSMRLVLPSLPTALVAQRVAAEEEAERQRRAYRKQIRDQQTAKLLGKTSKLSQFLLPPAVRALDTRLGLTRRIKVSYKGGWGDAWEGGERR